MYSLLQQCLDVLNADAVLIRSVSSKDSEDKCKEAQGSDPADMGKALLGICDIPIFPFRQHASPEEVIL